MLGIAGLHCIAFIAESFPLISRVRAQLQNLGHKNEHKILIEMNHVCLRLRPVCFSFPGLAQVKAHREKTTISELVVLEMIE